MPGTTTNFHLPTVEDGDTIDGATQLTALANAVDAALKQLQDAMPTQYVLPVASNEVLGGVKVGTGLSITPEGVLSSAGGGGGADLPIASASQLGGVKVGTGLNVGVDGTLSVNIDAILGSGTTWGELHDHGFMHK